MCAVWFDRSDQLWVCDSSGEIGPSSPIPPVKCPPSARHRGLIQEPLNTNNKERNVVFQTPAMCFIRDVVLWIWTPTPFILTTDDK